VCGLIFTVSFVTDGFLIFPSQSKVSFLVTLPLTAETRKKPVPLASAVY
jgi:hypothetical protein